MSDNGRLRFRVKRGDLEVELEGNFDYVKERFETLMRDVTLSPTVVASVSQISPVASPSQPLVLPLTLDGIVESGPDGKPRLTIPVDLITAKEALALILYALNPTQFSDEELSTMLSSSWKTMKSEAVRARASELRRDGRLVADKGKYNLSGAGIQWIQNDVLPKLKRS